MVFIFAVAGSGRADQVVSVDAAAGLITVQAKSGLKSYRLKPFTEVTINGRQGSLDVLKAGMECTISLADPSTASKITAIGNVAPGAALKPLKPGPIAPAGAVNGTRKITIRANIDGSDVFKIQDGKLWIEHHSWQKPVKVNVNGIPWLPQWTENRSDEFVAFNPPLAPIVDAAIVLRKGAGRGAVEMVEPATAKNNYTYSFKVDDGGAGGADNYEVRLSW